MAGVSDDSPELCVQAMWDEDHAARELGIRVQSVERGQADIAMTVVPTMVNGHGICHGGIIFSLADTAAAYAAGTFNVVSVAATSTITFLRPVHDGDELVASAREQVRVGRTGVFDVTVRRETETVAEVRALFRSLDRPILPNSATTHDRSGSDASGFRSSPGGPMGQP